MNCFILFDEEEVIREFAKRGLAVTNDDLTVGLRKAPAREPQIGWKCLTCGQVATLDKMPDGHCQTCLSVKLECIFGVEEYNNEFRKRKRIINSIKIQERRGVR